MKLIEILYSSRTHLNLLLFLSFFALSGCGKDAVPTRPPEPDPVPSRMVISPPSGSLTASGQTLQLTATLFDANGSPLTGFEIAWSSSNTAVATVDRNGLVTAHSGGTTQIIAAWGGVRNNITVMVSLGPSRIVVTPESVRFKARGETRQLEAVVLDADDVPIVNASVNWSSDNPAVVFVNSRGEIRAIANGEARITATTGSVSKTIVITVAQVPVRIILPRNSVQLASVGETTKLTAIVVDSLDAEILDAPLMWTSEDPTVATVDAQGEVTARMNGETRVTVSYGDISASVTVTVAQRAERIVVIPESVLLSTIGESIVVTVTVFDANDMEILDADLTWISDDPTVATVDSEGVITAQMNGETLVTVTHGELSAAVTVTVEQNAGQIVVVPESVTLSAIGESIVVSVSVFDANDMEILDADLTWTSDDPSVASVDDQGVVTAHMSGETLVTVTSGNLSTSVTVTVELQTNRIVVSPESVYLTSIGEMIQLTASVRDADEMEIPGVGLTLTSEDPAVASVDGQGVVTAHMNGETRIIVSWEELEASVSVVVSQVVDRIVVSQQFVHLPSIGDMVELVTTVYDAFNVEIQDAELMWTSEDPVVASVDEQGVVTAHMEGETSITVTSGALSASIRITVGQQTSRIVVSPDSVDMTSVGDTIQLIATAFDMGDREVPGAELTWTSEDPTVATVNNQGVVTAQMNGQTLVTVTWKDVSASVTVTVEQQAHRVFAAPQTVHFADVGETVELFVLVIDANDMEIPGAELAWSSENPTVATVDDRGVVTARMEGVTRVTVTSGAISAHVMVIVGTPTTLVVSTESVRLTAIGETFYAIAMVLDAYNQRIPGAELAWASRDPTVATVDDYGEITAQMNGQTIVTVTWEDMSDSISVVVAQQVDDLVVTPGSVHLSAVGETIQLAAAVFDANDVEITGAEVTWTSDNPSVASVDNRGLVTAQMTGTTDLTVTSASVSVTVVVSVGEVSSDRASLVHFYHATDGPNWQNNTNWLTNEPLDQWHGISVDSAGRVVSIWLNRNNLKGHIPAALASLDHLEILGLAHNELSGQIPTALGNLSVLQSLNLSINQFSGGIPSSLGQLSELSILDFQLNQLTGNIPSSLGNLTNLTYLRLGGNPLSGPIPPSLGRLDKLQRLFLSQAGLTGKIPSEFGGLESLKELHIIGNNLSGEIPAGLGNLEHMVSLDLRDNAGLRGPLPRTFLNLNLLHLQLFGTQVCIPRDLEFEEWKFSFHSRFALDCEAGPDLTALEAMYNWMGGKNWTNNTNWRSARPISEWYGVSVNSSSRVEDIELPGNGLVGNIQTALGGLADLERLNLANNSLSGGIPASLGKLSNLLLLNLQNNENLTGALPGALTGMTSLDTLRLDGTDLCVPQTDAFQTWLDGIDTKQFNYCETNTGN